MYNEGKEMSTERREYKIPFTGITLLQIYMPLRVNSLKKIFKHCFLPENVCTSVVVKSSTCNVRLPVL